MDEVLQLPDARRLLHPAQVRLGLLEPEDVELPPEEAAVAAVKDQRHVLEVVVDVRLLQLAVERVDERLHLLVDA